MKNTEQTQVAEPEKVEKSDRRLPRIGITLGDFNGIGPEIIMKVLADVRITKLFVPIIYGSSKVISRYKKLFGYENFTYYPITAGVAPSDKRINIVNCWEENYEIFPGEMKEDACECAFLALSHSTEDLKNGLLDAVVTAPIAKIGMQNADFTFPGHTEYYADAFGLADSLMLMVAGDLRIGAVTGHIPLSKVAEHLTREKIATKLNILIKSLQDDFGIAKPKIALVGLNPHAGEKGLLGSEEIDIINPVVEQFRKQGYFVYGTYPSDAFFGAKQYTQFDAVLTMYHDQGLIPFKILAFEDGVNFTAGLPYIRTSPDHGTAYDIAGKGIANENSLRAAIFLAIDLIVQRSEKKWKRQRNNNAAKALLNGIDEELPMAD